MELVLVDQYCMVTSIHRPARLPYIYVLSTNILVAHPLISYYVLQYYSTLINATNMLSFANMELYILLTYVLTIKKDIKI